jgi:hypothetical protein
MVKVDLRLLKGHSMGSDSRHNLATWTPNAARIRELFE